MSASAPAVSAVVATRDRPALLAECLASLRAQTLTPQRIVVVDSAPSNDDARRLVESQARLPSIVYAREPRPGLAVAHNRGLDLVRTPLVAFTDDDVVAERTWLERLVEGFAATSGVACVTGKIVPRELSTREQVWLDQYAAFDKGSERHVFDMSANRPPDPLFPFAAGRLGSGANMAFSTAALRAMGGFDDALGAGTRARGGDDLAAFFETVVGGHRLVYEPGAVVRHRHVSDYPGLRRQVYGYGVGLTAYLTKCVLDHPRSAARALRQLPRAAAHVLSRRSEKNGRLPQDYPRELVRLERLGMLVGPAAYLRARSHARRARRLG